ncbi:MAG: 4-hydroxybenzoate 3-monooxygenase [Candidatus Handelsmanbacteria bacterium RIFCSPLOWO2_12_FULL_64_10]|uniref:4-hydroxybenzoate 3-monooxygenase n=1 Tax=Handelsmanbacteria sp. (strain RIFCSPLOWO2_12_FULL_64_10) TaxID=1817868 RepID=A0A1F6D024_HANXR|nr:MAG: 4-hydroxybenzoate 3-monooxygenase [Candidatus Handelsmanbacteria bacterium RIFCSPLOWO2_12_FULL_64_10]
MRKTQIAIIGAGPAGLLLGHLLRAEGIDCVILERASPDYVLGRIRAGVLERTTTDLMHRLGIDERLNREGLLEEGFCLASGDDLIRIDTHALTGKHVTVYGQTKITRDLMEAAPARGLEVIYEAADVALHQVESDAPFVTYAKDGREHRLDARFIAGCDGYHGPSRKSVTGGQEYERVYPFGWLGILADVPPCHDELIYANHDRGFALASMRSKTRSRYYIDVPLTEKVEDWPDERLWEELQRRLPRPITTGPALEKSIAPLRSFIFDRMRHGSLFLAGDAAHIVPPTGAKGLNLAASDVAYLSDAMVRFFKAGDNDGIAGYAEKALARVWKASRFSWQLTRLMHRFPDDTQFDRRMQLAELDHVASSETARRAIAENYVGLPL